MSVPRCPSRTNLAWCGDWSAKVLAYRAMSDRLKLALAIAARTKPRFIEIPREKRSRVPFTEEKLNSIRGGLIP